MSLDCRLVDVNSDIFTDILRLNSEVFPSNELLAPINLEKQIYSNDENFQILAFFDDDKFIGYAAIYLYKELCYLAFLAIWPQFQGFRYGSKILDILSLKFKRIVLEIEYLDPKADDIDQRIQDSAHTISYLWMKYSIYSNCEFDFRRFIEMFELFKSKNYFEFIYE